MMRGITYEAMAVRKKDGSIHVESKEVARNKWYQKTPFIRGVFNFVLQLKNGYSYMMKSMEISGYLDDEEEEKKEDTNPDPIPEIPDDLKPEPEPELDSKSDSEDKKSSFGEMIVGVVGTIGGLAIGVLLFMFVPTHSFAFLNSLFEEYVGFGLNRSLTEGIIRIILFVLYMWAISLMKDIRKTYEYHGAEHKTIAAYEGGEKLDPDSPESIENVKKYTRFHPRCGTSFIFLVLAISILIYAILPIDSEMLYERFSFLTNLTLANIMRIAIQILLTPFIVAITYELIKLAGRYDRNLIMRAISAPGLALQRLTVREPDDKQIQIAIAAMVPVIPKTDDEKAEDKW